VVRWVVSEGFPDPYADFPAEGAVTEKIRRGGYRHPLPLSAGGHDAYLSAALSQGPHSVTPFAGSSLPPR